MKNNKELVEELVAFLENGEVDLQTITILQSAAIHASIKQGEDLRQSAVDYSSIAGAHKLLYTLLGVRASARDSLSIERVTMGNEAMFTPTQTPQPEVDMTDEEAQRAIKLLTSVFPAGPEGWE